MVVDACISHVLCLQSSYTTWTENLERKPLIKFKGKETDSAGETRDNILIYLWRNSGAVMQIAETFFFCNALLELLLHKVMDLIPMVIITVQFIQAFYIILQKLISQFFDPTLCHINGVSAIWGVRGWGGEEGKKERGGGKIKLGMCGMASPFF